MDKLDVGTGRRVIVVVDQLRLVPMPPNLDLTPLVGHRPWLRLRMGQFRLILRPLSADELRARDTGSPGYLVERVVYRRDLDDAIRAL